MYNILPQNAQKCYFVENLSFLEHTLDQAYEGYQSNIGDQPLCGYSM